MFPGDYALPGCLFTRQPMIGTLAGSEPPSSAASRQLAQLAPAESTEPAEPPHVVAASNLKGRTLPPPPPPPESEAAGQPQPPPPPPPAETTTATSGDHAKPAAADNQLASERVRERLGESERKTERKKEEEEEEKKKNT